LEPCVLQNSLWKNAALGLIGALFAVAGLAAGAATSVSRGSVVFFGLIGALFGYRAIDRRPRVIIDEKGIVDLRSSVGAIPWAEISDAKIVFAGRVDFIYITVRDADRWRAKLSVINRLFWRLFPNRQIIRVSLQNMTVSTDTVRDYLGEKMKLRTDGPIAAPASKGGC
jgi:hypothetical protein